MLVRSLVSGTMTGAYTLTHNAENRLVGVTGPDSTTTYTYNGVLAQVIAVMEGSQFVTKTIYIGSYYEYQIVETLTSTVATTRTYYFAGSTRVAMRDNGTLIFLLSDHLGSTSMTTDASGGVLSAQKYMPYGEVRGVGGLETDYAFTGQRAIAHLGIMNFNARHFDPSLGRFLEADTVLPGAGNVLAYDRFMFVLGNPVILVDPSGHVPCFEDGYCVDDNYSQDDHLSYLQNRYDIEFVGNWSFDDMWSVMEAVHTVASKMGNSDIDISSLIFKAVFRGLSFTRVDIDPGYWGEYSSGNINIYSGAREWEHLIPHELGHAFNARLADRATKNPRSTPYNTLYYGGIHTENGVQIGGLVDGVYERTYLGLGFHMSNRNLHGEDYADTFANWVSYSITNDSAGYGQARQAWMDSHIVQWVNLAFGR